MEKANIRVLERGKSAYWRKRQIDPARNNRYTFIEKRLLTVTYHFEILVRRPTLGR
jgi:hypothetical protein